MRKILVIDNYDSFVFTIVSYLRQLNAQVTVIRNDDPSLDGPSLNGPSFDGPSALDGFDGVLVSPGPGNPQSAGHSLDVIGWCAERRQPMLGVCLGHQALGEYFGATVASAPTLQHGKTSLIVHEGSGIFDAVPAPFSATRYHSLAVLPETVPPELVVTATTEDGVIMGLQHRKLPLHGVQFHPESVLTEHGHLMLANWLAVTGDETAVERSKGLAPLIAAETRAGEMPAG